MRIKESGALYHYGIPGMKWGVRRYQNEDGSLTERGKDRYLLNKHGGYVRKSSRLRHLEQRLNKARERGDVEKAQKLAKKVHREKARLTYTRPETLRQQKIFKAAVLTTATLMSIHGAASIRNIRIAKSPVHFTPDIMSQPVNSTAMSVYKTASKAARIAQNKNLVTVDEFLNG